MSGYLLVCARAMVGLVLLVSAGSKVRSRAAYTGFGTWVGQLTVVPAGLTGVVALVVVTAEAVTVPLVAIPATAFLGLTLAAVQMAVLAASIRVITRRGVSVPCRCFGVSTRPVGAVHLTRAILLAGVAGTAAAATAALGPGRAPSPADTGLALFSGIAAAAVIIRLDDIIPR